jgi:hypothetical protein
MNHHNIAHWQWYPLDCEIEVDQQVKLTVILDNRSMFIKEKQNKLSFSVEINWSCPRDSFFLFLSILQIRLLLSYLLRQVLVYTLDHHRWTNDAHTHKYLVSTTKRNKMINFDSLRKKKEEDLRLHLTKELKHRQIIINMFNKTNEILPVDYWIIIILIKISITYSSKWNNLQ